MTEFQVGDQVSIGGTVTAIIGRERLFIQLITPVGNLLQVDPEELALVERPRKKLRVGSVWERWGVYWAVGTNQDGDQHLVRLSDGARVEIDLIAPSEWREVPVEELEREAS